mmetsp:Transcript_24263/g.35283  ORF Transcript_24263/g.35283 Transcript_24263/m.35283 type:complete len:196 (-) Transcript_24263:382-969(-)
MEDKVQSDGLDSASQGYYGETTTGSAAPAFTLPGPGFVNFSLSTLSQDSRKVVLAFFPAAFSQGNASYGFDSMLEELNKRSAALEAGGYTVVGISKELPFTMEALMKRMALKFPVLSDASLEVSHQYVGTFDLGAHLDGKQITRDLSGYTTCNRGLVAVASGGQVMYKWVAVEEGKPNPGVLPDWDDFESKLGLC